MTDQVMQRRGVAVLVCDPAGAPVASEQDALDLIGASFGRAEIVAVPASRLDERFFTLRTGFAACGSPTAAGRSGSSPPSPTWTPASPDPHRTPSPILQLWCQNSPQFATLCQPTQLQDRRDHGRR
jgi:hypothetical protein